MLVSSYLRQCRLRFVAPRHTRLLPFRRTIISNDHEPSELRKKPIRTEYRVLFTTLLTLGVASLGYGIYEMYRRMTIWPSALRQDLRDALRRKYKDDFEASEAFFRRAWANAKSLSPSELGPQPYLKTTGIAIALGSMLESTDHLDKAYDVYNDALSHIQEAGEKTPLSNEEHLRGIKLACKLAEMSNTLGRNSEEEKWLTWAVQAILKSMPPNKSTKVHHSDISQDVRPGDDNTLGLPTWVSSTDFAAPFEALGSLYARTDRNEYALPVLLQATTILIPPSRQTSSPADRCRGALTMSTISEIIMRIKPTEEGLAQAEAWSCKALDIAESTRDKMHKKEKWRALLGKSTDTDETCEIALAVSLFNIGILREMAGDKNEAKKYLILSLKQSKMIGLDEGVVVAEDALQKL